MKISLIVTILNEEKTVGRLLKSVSKQTRKPEEVIIVDGGSKDGTVAKMEEMVNHPDEHRDLAKLEIIKKRGNRAAGRNAAIRRASGEIIAITDAGCELKEDWIEKIIEPFENDGSFTRPPLDWPAAGKEVAFGTIDVVVAGYYEVSKESSVFERCVACYALVPPDKVQPEKFLPSSRSMAIRKSVWEKFGGFPEDFDENEDYVFANILKKGGAKIVFAKDAIVYWSPRDNLKDFFWMIYRFAKGDARAGLRRGKVATVFGRYIILGILGWLGILGYAVWAVLKNYKYIGNWQAVFILPVLQVVADLAVMSGTIKGNCDKLRRFN